MNGERRRTKINIEHIRPNSKYVSDVLQLVFNGPKEQKEKEATTTPKKKRKNLFFFFLSRLSCSVNNELSLFFFLILFLHINVLNQRVTSALAAFK